jgi:hypothetical protein
MKAILLALLCSAALAWAAPTQDLVQQYTPSGQMLLTHFASAPFPHPKRAEGHQYKDQFYSAQEHYSDNTVALFIPKGFRETGSIDLVVHFHGWKNHVEGVLQQYHLIEQLVESGRNAVLVVPQGPRDASDSFGGKLEDPDGFKRFIAEVAETLRQKGSLKNKDFSIGNVVLSGHSGGYQVISSILDHGGLADQVKEVWLFDALYAQTDKFLAWFDAQHGRLLNIYTEHGGTKEETERLMATLKQRGTPFLSCKEAELKPAELQTNQVVFIYTELPHNDVLDKHQTFLEFLKTSVLAKRGD